MTKWILIIWTFYGEQAPKETVIEFLTLEQCRNARVQIIAELDKTDDTRFGYTIQPCRKKP